VDGERIVPLAAGEPLQWQVTTVETSA